MRRTILANSRSFYTIFKMKGGDSMPLFLYVLFSLAFICIFMYVCLLYGNYKKRKEAELDEKTKANKRTD